MDKMIRRIELDTGKMDETKEYMLGFQAGIDRARWQIVRLVLAAIIGWFIIGPWIRCISTHIN
jgi:hypothetical protein